MVVYFRSLQQRRAVGGRGGEARAGEGERNQSVLGRMQDILKAGSFFSFSFFFAAWMWAPYLLQINPRVTKLPWFRLLLITLNCSE